MLILNFSTRLENQGHEIQQMESQMAKSTK